MPRPGITTSVSGPLPWQCRYCRTPAAANTPDTVLDLTATLVVAEGRAAVECTGADVAAAGVVAGTVAAALGGWLGGCLGADDEGWSAGVAASDPAPPPVAAQPWVSALTTTSAAAATSRPDPLTRPRLRGAAARSSCASGAVFVPSKEEAGNERGKP